MTTVNPEHAEHSGSTDSMSGRESSRVRVRPLARARALLRSLRDRWQRAFGSLTAALDRPLTNYYLLLGAGALLLVLGVIMVFSASSVRSWETYGDSYYLVKRQLMWVALGLPLAWVASRIPIKQVRRLAYPGFLVSIVLLVLVSQFGTEVGGNKNWLSLGPIGIQPSEVAKLAIVLWAAHIYAAKERRLGELHHLLVPVLPGMGVMIGLVLLGRDLGTALVFAGILMAMLWVVGAPTRIFAVAFSVLAVGALFFATTNANRLSRLTTFVNPFSDYHTTGWQPAHGLFALSTGGVFGVGLGGSSQKWGGLAEAHTDFIFAVIGEELGLVGTLLVLALFLTIAWAGIRVALHTDQPFIRYMSFGIVAWLLSQMIINVGMVLGLLPVIGIPLPLISYGGSALLPSLVALGLLVGFARRDPEATAALASRRKGRSAGLSAGRRSTALVERD